MNQCVAECLEQNKKLLVTDIQSLIAQTLGLNIDKATSSLSGMCVCTYIYMHM